MKTLACMFLVGVCLAADEPVKPAAPTKPAVAAKPTAHPAGKRTSAPASKATTPPAKPVRPTPKPVAKPSLKPVVLPTIPKDAVQTSPGLFRWKDKDGKVWMYRSTPFGVSKWQADSQEARLDAAEDQTIAVEAGDSIRFERPTPFGKHTWVRKKTDLDETEQLIWTRQQHKAGLRDTAEKAEKE